MGGVLPPSPTTFSRNEDDASRDATLLELLMGSGSLDKGHDLRNEGSEGAGLDEVEGLVEQVVRLEESSMGRLRAATALANRQAFYLMGGLKANANLLAELGPHKVGGGCLYLPRLEEIDTKVLMRLIRLSHKANRQSLRPPA